MATFLQVTSFCRFIVKSCRIFDSKLFKYGGCATSKVTFPSLRFCCIFWHFSMIDFELLFIWFIIYVCMYALCTNIMALMAASYATWSKIKVVFKADCGRLPSWFLFLKMHFKDDIELNLCWLFSVFFSQKESLLSTQGVRIFLIAVCYMSCRQISKNQ